MKVILIGVVYFSQEMFKEILKNKQVEIVGVLTKKKSKFNSDFIDLSIICQKENIDWKYFKNINDKENIDWIKSKNSDFIFCLGVSQIIRKEILDIPKKGVIGYHPALLPKNRGRHPIIWPIVLGLSETGSTFFFMNEGADSGDVLSQEKIKFKPNIYANDLYLKIIEVAKDQINQFLPLLIENTYDRIPQDNLDANYWRKRSKNDGLINYNNQSIVIDRLVRALSTPYPCAYTIFNGEEIKVRKIEILSSELINIEPGKVLEVKGKLITIKTSDGAIQLIEHDFINLPKKGDYLL